FRMLGEHVMLSIGVRFAAIATIVALALPASAAPRGGGGGGGHFGGGGGGHFSGGHMGGGHMGGMHFSAPMSRGAFARPSFSGGGVRSFAGPMRHVGFVHGYSPVRMSRGGRSFAALGGGARHHHHLGRSGYSRLSRAGHFHNIHAGRSN